MSLKFINGNILKLGNQHAALFSEGIFKGKTSFMFGVFGAPITSKAFREDKHKPAPFPYKEKRYSFLRSYFDITTSRFDENSKIIVIDGSIAVGKSKFAKELAKELDFYHINDANMDIKYITPSGFDLRQLDCKLPLSMQSYDEKKFCQHPKHLNTAAFQVWMYRLRFSLYVDALAHLFSTGQGVVIERSPWSDIVFMEAMCKNGYISKAARRGYLEVRRNTIFQVLKPHLVIYLDVPVPKIMANIKRRALPHECNSPALTDKYLQDVEDFYKTEYLAKVGSYAELLMYDWSEPGDIEAVVEDIERIDFERFTKYDEKFQDWHIGKEQDWALLRHKFADQKARMMHFFNVPFFDAPELVAPGEDIEVYNKVVYNTPGLEYADGFHPSSESNLLFKMKEPKYVKY